MRILPTTAAVALSLALALSLSGCLPQQPIVQPTPAPSSTPVFASEEEALAAAEAAYGEYVKVADQIFMEGGVGAERLERVATGDFLEASIQGFVNVEGKGLRSSGGTVFRDVVLQAYSGGEEGIVSVYLCEDISAVDVLDSTGNSVVSPNRPDTTLFQVIFDLSESEPHGLLVSSREPWSDTPC